MELESLIFCVDVTTKAALSLFFRLGFDPAVPARHLSTLIQQIELTVDKWISSLRANCQQKNTRLVILCSLGRQFSYEIENSKIHLNAGVANRSRIQRKQNLRAQCLLC